MKVKLLFVTAAVLLMAALSFGQNFSGTLNYTEIYNDQGELIYTPPPLTTLCGGTVPIADETPVYIYDNNTGALACLYSETHTNGCHNFNTFLVNGDALLGQPGTFIMEIGFTSVGITMGHTYHVEILGDVECIGGRWMRTVWVGPNFTPAPGSFDLYWYFEQWTCVLRDEGPCGSQCVPSEDYTFGVPVPPYAAQVPVQSVCLHLCYSKEVYNLCIPTEYDWQTRPHVSVQPGCMIEGVCYEPDCPPAAGFIYNPDPAAWVPMYIGGVRYLCNTITLPAGGVEGCVCVIFDYIEPVGGVAVTMAPMDGAVKMAWTTSSETNVDKYVIVRDGADLASVKATNNANGSEYSYVDESAENGHAYTYSLAVVNLDGSRSTLYTSEAVTPSELAAVITEYALHQNFPNPFNPTTSIRFDLVEDNFVTLKVYNATGQEVTTLVNGNRAKGVNFVNFDASNLTTGLYFYTISVGDVYSSTKKMLLVK